MEWHHQKHLQSLLFTHSLIVNQADQNLCISEPYHPLLSLGCLTFPHNTDSHTRPRPGTHSYWLFSTCCQLTHPSHPSRRVIHFLRSPVFMAHIQGIPAFSPSFLHALFIMVLSYFIFWLSCILFYVLGYSFLVYVCLHIQHSHSPSHSAFYALKTRLFVFGIISWWVYADVYINRHVSFFIIT